MGKRIKANSTLQQAAQEYDLLSNVVCWTQAKWVLAKGLYGDANSVSHMNNVSPTGFAILQRCLHNEVISAMCAATDKPETMGKSNLTIKRLLDSHLHHADAKHRTKIESLERKLDEAMKPVRRRRHRAIAHFDLDSLVSREIPELNLVQIDTAMGLLCEVMKQLSYVVKTQWELHSTAGPGNAVGELQWLVSDGVRYRMLRDIAKGHHVSDADFRRIVSDRSGRGDSAILQTHGS